ncbi:Inner membrane protein YrbG, predicted calcium/sodium:proton antiporter [hydrothermal vent metagenome]|uniref:Inner membrane protein YrbG, predicted calcium/sodium:proton antiporter n=1 Tax=hydrothermal vent metagenome TaxID=652676 RepID=A0A3B0W666_9ZZZZ
MIEALAFLIVGLVLLVYAADKFVMGAAATASYLGVSSMVVGLIVIGFGTSAPEMVISAIAALQGNPGLALGNAVGSNTTNIALVLGVGIIVSPLMIGSNTVKREMPILLLVTLFVMLLMWDGEQTRLDGAILITSMFAMTLWMAWLGLKQSKNKDNLQKEFEAELPQDVSKKAAWLWLLFGMIMLPVASHSMVHGATTIAQMLGMTDVVIGLTVVALGTSLPELSATIACMKKKEYDLALGNIVGSNMFNLLGVLGISASIKAYKLPENFLATDYFLMLNLTLALLLFSMFSVARKKPIPRAAGYFFVIIYCVYMFWLFKRG